MTDRIPASELSVIKRFAEKCFGYRLNLMACMEVIRFARGWSSNVRNVDRNVFRIDLIRIGYAYREVMDIKK